MAASASVILPGRIFSISLRAVALRCAWAIKPTTRCPLSNQGKAEVGINKLTMENSERKTAVNEDSEVSIRNLYADEGELSRFVPRCLGEDLSVLDVAKRPWPAGAIRLPFLRSLDMHR